MSPMFREPHRVAFDHLDERLHGQQNGGDTERENEL